jgi:hypothetical protein
MLFHNRYIDISTASKTTVHLSKPVRDLWLVSQEEAANLPTSDFKAVGYHDKLESLYYYLEQRYGHVLRERKVNYNHLR